MSQGISFNIYVMSYKRPNEIITKNSLEYCTYVVRECEADAYRASGIEDMLIIPEGATTKSGCRVFNFMTTLYWLIENSPEDVIFVADDDITTFYYKHDTIKRIDKLYPNPVEIQTSEIERIAQLMVDLNIGLGFDCASKSVYNYTGPFEFKGTPGFCRWINKKALKATITPEDMAVSDVDMMMQELLLNRIILNPRYFVGLSHIDVPEGGSAEFGTSDETQNYVLAMKNKWGKYIDFNWKRNYWEIKVKR